MGAERNLYVSFHQSGETTDQLSKFETRISLQILLNLDLYTLNKNYDHGVCKKIIIYNHDIVGSLLVKIMHRGTSLYYIITNLQFLLDSQHILKHIKKSSFENLFSIKVSLAKNNEKLQTNRQKVTLEISNNLLAMTTSRSLCKRHTRSAICSRVH
jgi:hypothetical protein